MKRKLKTFSDCENEFQLCRYCFTVLSVAQPNVLQSGYIQIISLTVTEFNLMQHILMVLKRFRFVFSGKKVLKCPDTIFQMFNPFPDSLECRLKCIHS